LAFFCVWGIALTVEVKVPVRPLEVADHLTAAKDNELMPVFTGAIFEEGAKISSRNVQTRSQ
jgi:hypothetical protein